jgi:hypothetical protein
MWYLRITPEYDGYEDSSVNDVRIEKVTQEQVLAEMQDYYLNTIGLLRIGEDEKKKLSPYAVDALKKRGWVHKASALTRAEKKAVEQKFYIINEQGQAYAYYNPKFAELDMDNLSDDIIKALANGGEIFQKVTYKSVLSPKDYKRLLTARSKKKAAIQKAKAAKATKEAKKKAKEIEKAKKLLEEAGEIQPEQQ